MRAQRDEIPPGTLEMLILQTLARGEALHGFAIADSILQRSEDVLTVEEGSLYSGPPANARQGLDRRRMGQNPGQSPRPLLPPDPRRPASNYTRKRSATKRVARAIALILRPA